MNKTLHFSAVLLAGFLAVGCEKKPTAVVVIPAPTPLDVTRTPESATTTLETKKLGVAINQYIATPNAENAADVRKAFADLDGEIAELEARVAKTTGADRDEAQGKLTNMQAYRTTEAARYTAAGATAPLGAAMTPVDTRSGAEKVEDSLDKAGNKIENTAEKIGESIKDGAENATDKVKDATGN